MQTFMLFEWVCVYRLIVEGMSAINQQLLLYRDRIVSDLKVAFSRLLPSTRYRQEGRRRENATLQSLHFPPRYNHNPQVVAPIGEQLANPLRLIPRRGY